jgi:hypothetical protein
MKTSVHGKSHPAQLSPRSSLKWGINMVTVSDTGWNESMPCVIRLVQKVGNLLIDLRSVVSQLRPPINIFLHLREVVSIDARSFSK